MMKDSPKVGYTEHLLSSSISFKNKGVLINHDRGKFKRTGQVYKKTKTLLAASLLSPLNMAHVCLCHTVGEYVCLLSQNHFHESSYSKFEYFKECLGCRHIMV